MSKTTSCFNFVLMLSNLGRRFNGMLTLLYFIVHIVCDARFCMPVYYAISFVFLRLLVKDLCGKSRISFW